MLIDSSKAYHVVVHGVPQTVLLGMYHNYPHFVDGEIEVPKE